jgi:hypothetical protein
MYALFFKAVARDPLKFIYFLIFTTLPLSHSGSPCVHYFFSLFSLGITLKKSAIDNF